MIQANELRIGNSLLYKENIVAVTVLSVNTKNFSIGYIAFNEFGKTDGQIGGNIEGLGNKLERVPLTPELLEKCGFEETDDSWYYLSKSEPLFQLHPEQSEKYSYSHIWDGAFTGRVISALHELQNLYFALTGKELEIKL